MFLVILKVQEVMLIAGKFKLNSFGLVEKARESVCSWFGKVGSIV